MTYILKNDASSSIIVDVEHVDNFVLLKGEPWYDVQPCWNVNCISVHTNGWTWTFGL